MSVSPTDDALIVALDFEGESGASCRQPSGTILYSGNNRRTQSGAFGPGGHTSCPLQHRYFESREQISSLSRHSRSLELSSHAGSIPK